MTPREVVSQLDKFIVGQQEAKKAVAIAFRNRWRRHHLSDEMRNEVIPKNILMIGPTGCGKVRAHGSLPASLCLAVPRCASRPPPHVTCHRRKSREG